MATMDESTKRPAYMRCVNADVEAQLLKGIRQKLITERRYRERDFSAQLLAQQLQTNTRYVSVVLRRRFGLNYTMLVNKLRVQAAVKLMGANLDGSLKMQDVADAVGFSTRQSFCSAFSRFTGKTPRQYLDELRHTLP